MGAFIFSSLIFRRDNGQRWEMYQMVKKILEVSRYKYRAV